MIRKAMKILVLKNHHRKMMMIKVQMMNHLSYHQVAIPYLIPTDKQKKPSYIILNLNRMKKMGLDLNYLDLIYQEH